MAKNDGSYIDGFSSVRAVRRAKTRGPGSKPKSAEPRRPAPKPAAKPPDGAAAQTRIGQTAMPARYDILCYLCGYAFVVQGNLKDTLCPKCHKFLDVGDHVIDSEWTRDLQTVGRIEVKPGGHVKGATLLARSIVLAGNIEEATIKNCQTLELRTGARFDPKGILASDIVVHETATLSVTQPLACRNLDIRGKLTAKVTTEGVVTIRPGGCLRGTLRGPHLVVEDGGGLLARVKLHPPPPAKPESKTPSAKPAAKKKR